MVVSANWELAQKGGVPPQYLIYSAPLWKEDPSAGTSESDQPDTPTETAPSEPTLETISLAIENNKVSLFTEALKTGAVSLITSGALLALDIYAGRAAFSMEFAIPVAMQAIRKVGVISAITSLASKVVSFEENPNIAKLQYFVFSSLVYGGFTFASLSQTNSTMDQVEIIKHAGHFLTSLFLSKALG